ncbi:hypothetical protein ES703_118185 [subsurface metagenome]
MTSVSKGQRGNEKQKSRLIVFGQRGDGTELALCVGHLYYDLPTPSTFSLARGNWHICTGSNAHLCCPGKGLAGDPDFRAPGVRFSNHHLKDCICVQLLVLSFCKPQVAHGVPQQTERSPGVVYPRCYPFLCPLVLGGRSDFSPEVNSVPHHLHPL